MTVFGGGPASAGRVATRGRHLAASVPSWRSRFRTPASRVYSQMTSRRAASVISHHVGRQAVLGHLPRQQVLAGDVELLLLAVAGQLDDLHAVEQRRMNGAQLVRRGDEQHPRQIDRDLEVVVAERVVLRRVQHLEQRRGRVALVSPPVILSISSSMNTGFIEPACFSAWTIRPGIEPM